MELGKKFCLSLLKEGVDLSLISSYGIDETFFTGYGKKIYNFMMQYKAKYGKFPSQETTVEELNLGEIEFSEVPEEPFQFYIDELIKRSDWYKLKELSSKLNKGIEQIHIGNQDVNGVISSLKETLMEIELSKSKKFGQVINLRTDIKERVQECIDLVSSQKLVKYYRTPWGTLDHFTLGHQKGHFWSIVASSGIGKTWSSIFFFNNFAAQAHLEDFQGNVLGPPLYISLEMPTSEIAFRSDAHKYKLNHRELVTGKLFPTVLDDYMNKLDAKEGNDYFLAGSDVVKTVADIHILVDYYNPGAIVIDGFEFLKNNKRTKHERVEQIADDLTELALLRDVHVLGTAQFRSIRDSKGDSNDSLTKHGAGDVSDSEKIRKNSYCMLGLYQNNDLYANKRMLVKLLKNRGEGKVNFLCNWDFDKMDFSELCEADYEGNPLY